MRTAPDWGPIPLELITKQIYLFMETVKKRMMNVLSVMDIEIQLEDRLKHYMDSMDKVEFVMMLEKEFNILISDKEISEIDTLEDVLNLLNKKVDAN